MDGRCFPTEPWNGESENAEDPKARADALSGKGAFFGYFLCTGKESNSPSGESCCFWLLAPTAQDQKLSRWRASSFLLLAQKKRTKEKGPPRSTLNRNGEDGRNFPTRHSMARSENGRHPWRPPHGFSCIHGHLGHERKTSGQTRTGALRRPFGVARQDWRIRPLRARPRP